MWFVPLRQLGALRRAGTTIYGVHLNAHVRVVRVEQRPAWSRHLATVTVPSIEEAAAPPKSRRFGAVVFDWIVGHPALFLAGIFGPLFVYIAYGVRDNSARDALVTALDGSAPVCARELTAIGRDNLVPPRAFGVAAARVLASSAASQRATPSEVSHALRSAWRDVSLANGASIDTSHAVLPSIAGEHHILRAVAALASQSVHAASGALHGSSEHSFADFAADAEVEPGLLLSLYGTTMGGRGETAADAGVDSNAPPSPSERLAIWLSLARASLDMRADSPVLFKLRVDASRGVDVSRSVPVSICDTAAPGGGSPLSSILPPVVFPISEDIAVELIRILSETWQLPPRTRVKRVVDFPLPVYAARTPSDHMAAALEECKIFEQRKDTGDSTATEARLYSEDEIRSLFLKSKAICAWGECYASDVVRRGGLLSARA